MIKWTFKHLTWKQLGKFKFKMADTFFQVCQPIFVWWSHNTWYFESYWSSNYNKVKTAVVTKKRGTTNIWLSPLPLSTSAPAGASLHSPPNVIRFPLRKLRVVHRVGLGLGLYKTFLSIQWIEPRVGTLPQWKLFYVKYFLWVYLSNCCQCTVGLSALDVREQVACKSSEGNCF